MRLRTPVAVALAAATLTTTVATGAASVAAQSDSSESSSNIVDVVLDVSGAEGFDHRGRDYDLLREALLATGLADAVATTPDITVFAPNDRAFIRLARDLGFHGHDEAGAFAFLADATGFQSADEPGLLADVLLYHVAPGVVRSTDLVDGQPIETLLGASVTPDGFRLIDGDRNARDPKIRTPFDVEASNGVIHTINRVLRPIDLPPEIPASAVDLVIAASGAEGFDHSSRDYDLLREALVATGLADAVASADDITVFAPNDRAFIRLARDLGFRGHDEAGAFAFLAEATGFQSADEPGLLADVLLYHVAPGGGTVAELQGDVPTLFGPSVTVDGRTVIDADPDDRDAKIRRPFDAPVGNGFVHTVNRVLRPIDL
ncbi:MAG: fasciclin domain-containing protein [Actinomycetota bacterium]